MQFLLLGPFSVVDGDRTAAVGKGNERALVALLALHANTVVSTDRIIDAIWGDRSPATARDMVRLYVGRARSRIGDRLVTEANGYRLRTENGEVDVAELERLRRAGTEAIAAGDAVTAAAHLAEAIGLVRGEPLAEFGEFPFAREEIPRLDELLLGTTEDYYDARLTAGEATELVAALDQLVDENPYRERLRGQLMLALYRSGRQTDALARYQEGRRLLADEVGIEPSPHLRELERAILQHDPGLMPDRRKSREAVRNADSPPRRRRWLAPALVALLVLGGGVAALVFTQTGGRAGLASLPPHSLGSVDPATGRLESSTLLHGNAVDLTGSEGRVWVAFGEPHQIAEIDPSSGKLSRPIPLHSVSPRRIGPGRGGVWIADSYNGTMSRVATANGAQGKPQYPFGRRPFARISFAGGPGTLWVASDTAAEAAKVNPRTGRVIRQVRGLDDPLAIATGFGALWLASATSAEVQRVQGVKPHTIPIGSLPAALAAGSKAVWVVSPSDGKLTRIDPQALDVEQVISVGLDPRSVAVGGGSVWVGSPQTGTLLRVSPNRNRVVQRIHIGRPVSALTFYDGRLWVAAD